MTITENKPAANTAQLVTIADELLTRYKSVSKIERNAILRQIDSFLPAVAADVKTFWLKFRAKLVAIDEPKFSTGRLIVSAHAQLALMRSEEDPAKFLQRHQSGDFGDIDERQAAINQVSLKAPGPIISIYKTSLSRELWIITEPNRAQTLILVPEEY